MYRTTVALLMKKKPKKQKSSACRAWPATGFFFVSFFLYPSTAPSHFIALCFACDVAAAFNNAIIESRDRLIIALIVRYPVYSIHAVYDTLHHHCICFRFKEYDMAEVTISFLYRSPSRSQK